ncbi:hypothetical protein MAR_012734, partial [Mya arenaria]
MAVQHIQQDNKQGYKQGILKRQAIQSGFSDTRTVPRGCCVERTIHRALFNLEQYKGVSNSTWAINTKMMLHHIGNTQ